MEKLELDLTSMSIRKEWSWTPRNLAQCDDIKSVLAAMSAYWPLTVRQLYYRLISTDKVQASHWQWNDKQVDIYKALVRTLNPQGVCSFDLREAAGVMNISAVGSSLVAQLRGMSNDLGLSPAGRERLTVKPPAKKDNPFDQFRTKTR